MLLQVSSSSNSQGHPAKDSQTPNKMTTTTGEMETMEETLELVQATAPTNPPSIEQQTALRKEHPLSVKSRSISLKGPRPAVRPFE